jgi:hypothetical protein
MVAGDVQSSGTLYVDVYQDGSATASKTGLSISMTAARFKQGYMLPIEMRGHSFKFRLRNSEAATSVVIDSIGIAYSDMGYDR